MAATNYTPISLYYSTTAAAAPTAGNLVNGELAINITDGKLYYKDNLGAVKVIAGAGGAGVAGGSNTQVQYNSSGSLAGSANMTFDGTTLTVNGLSTTGTVTVGDASGDALTINSSAVSIPNGLNFDSNTFVIDATNNYVGVGTSSPDAKLRVDLNGGGLVSKFVSNTGSTYITVGAASTYQTQFGYNIASEYGFIQPIAATGVYDDLAICPSGGNVGIGTSSPSNKLQVTDSTAAQALFAGWSQTGANASSGAIRLGGNASYQGRIDYAADGNTTFTLENTYASGIFNWKLASSEKMRIDSSGNLLVGSTGVGGGQTFKTTVFTNTANTVTNNLMLSNKGTGTGSGVRLSMSGYDNSDRGAYIEAAINSGSNGHYLAFATQDAGYTPSEKMRIDYNGNVGIGISNPGGKLDISGTSRQIFYVSDAYTENRSINSAGSAFAKQAYNALSYDWGLSNTFGKMTLDSSGNLGLGVTPSAWETSSYKAIDINSGVGGIYGGSSRFGLTNNAYLNTSGVWTYKATGTATRYQSYSGEHQFYTAASGTAGNAITFTQAMTLDASGNLGIGTTSPAKRLHLYASNNAASVRFTNTAANKVWEWTPSLPNVTNTGFSLYNVTDDTVPLYVTDSGNVGIGASAPYAALDVYRSGGSNLSITHSTSGGTYPKASGISFGAYSTSLSVSSNGSTISFVGGAGIYANNTASSGNPTNLVFWTNDSGTPAERMRIDSIGNLLVGTTSALGKLGVMSSTNGDVIGAFRCSGTGTQRALLVSVDNSTGVVKLDASGAAAGILAFAYGGTEAMRIDTSGNALFAKAVRATITTDNDLSFDMNAASNFKCTPSAGGALTFTNITSGQTGNIILVNGSNYAITAAATTKVSATCLATISATGTYWLSYYSDGTNVYVANTGALA